MEKEVFVQVGVTALRAADGSFLPSVPLYIKAPKKDVNPKTGRYEGEEAAIKDIASVFADKFKQYVDGTKKKTKEQGGQHEQDK